MYTSQIKDAIQGNRDRFQALPRYFVETQASKINQNYIRYLSLGDRFGCFEIDHFCRAGAANFRRHVLNIYFGS